MSILRPGQADIQNGEADPEMLRISRIGKTLFDVANCVIKFGDAPPTFADGGRSIESIETAFCYSLPLQESPVVVQDARNHASLGQHRSVAGAPYIRFYATHPVYNVDRTLAGSVSLVDYSTRPAFRERELLLLADLAALVERELHLRHANASQLDLQKKNKNLRRRSLIDPLIGTWNRGAIMRILTIEAIRCDKAGEPLSLIVVDLDFFKKINDTYGHPAGDTVLVKVASRLRSCIRPQEALGRYGGEEFLIVLPGSSHSTAMAVAERMRVAIASQPEAIAGTSLNLTISAGVASTDLFPTATTEELISRADMALYAAKDAGRNRVVKATPDLS
ncbi:MAG TPA: GGDEF domain-containing protein [Noviherbaspirillum sp.]|uniref:GGDEF domain-containing protein n=1 Tax=Noviherbaspirillum sp. TaxID=1926288 RepID=UPI002B46216B|nr:GGDEF domain-containing protein [Noviherbaspirillum sp.]HJV87136.1 GGDEF domain-containing protein [Noviherbaspirillum sp.]